MSTPLITTTDNPKLPGHLIERVVEPSRMSWRGLELIFDLNGNKWMTNADVGAAFGVTGADASHLTRMMFDAGALERMKTPGARIGFSYRINTKEKKV